MRLICAAMLFMTLSCSAEPKSRTELQRDLDRASRPLPADSVMKRLRARSAVSRPTPSQVSPRAVIDNWLVRWSTAQTASARASCMKDAACNPADYVPQARPETTFGWNGARSIERIPDWAKGPRYWVEANGRRVLLYFDGNRIVGAYIETADGGRSNICGERSCNP